MGLWGSGSSEEPPSTSEGTSHHLQENFGEPPMNLLGRGRDSELSKNICFGMAWRRTSPKPYVLLWFGVLIALASVLGAAGRPGLDRRQRLGGR